jgi:hypothetical protein
MSKTDAVVHGSGGLHAVIAPGPQHFELPWEYA